MLRRFLNWQLNRMADAERRGWVDYPSADMPRVDTTNAPFHMPPDVEPIALSDKQKAMIKTIAKRLTAEGTGI